MAQTWAYNKDILSGIYRRDGGVVPALQVELLRAGVHVDTETTDTFGAWAFTITQTGSYTVKFHGGGSIPADDIENIPLAVGDPIGTDIIFATTPSFTVTELTTSISVDGQEIVNVQLDFFDLDTIEGILATIEIYYKRTAESSYKLLTTLPILAKVSTDSTVTSFTPTKKPDFYDFKCIFLNNVSSVYKQASVTFEAFVLNKEIFAITGVSDYTEVWNLTTDLIGNTIICNWADIKAWPESSFDPSGIQTQDAFGNEYYVTYNVAQNISEYGIFVFTSGANIAPSPTYPGPNWSGSQWYLATSTVTPTGEVTVPPDIYASVWVGFLTDDSNTEYNRPGVD